VVSIGGADGATGCVAERNDDSDDYGPCIFSDQIEAFAGRGKSDLLGSHDMEDIVNVLDGRPEIVEEVAASPDELKRYLVDRCNALLALPNFMDALSGMVFPDESLAERVKMIGLRLKQIAGI